MNAETLFAFRLMCEAYLTATAFKHQDEGRDMPPKLKAFADENNISVCRGMIVGIDHLRKGASWSGCFSGGWEDAKAQLREVCGNAPAIETLLEQIDAGEVTDPDVVADVLLLLKKQTS